ncbi:hypothetical protein B0H17DRAFT_1092308 [Mycena rosella]|uniref:Uncharacterized protein n=1 Tax=Mycena rosella TaxID=1033263 RepID=A0AAD7CUP7_MYCRO|nr:hypothetical protein B0H17DRAFT_1092308 [Mycena rosella]
MSAVPLLSANLAVAVLESFLYGIYLLLLLLALYLKAIRHHEPLTATPRWSSVVFGALLLFLLITAHWILNIVRLFMAFNDTGREPEAFYADLSHSTEVAKYAFFVASLSVADFFLIHRLWAVWEFRTRIIVFPSVTFVGFIAFGVGLTYQLSTYSSNDNIFQAAFRRWTTGICFFSLCTAAYTTGFVWYKLWTTSRVLKSLGISSLGSIIRIFIDSAALIAIWGTFHVVSYQCGSNLQFIAVDCTPPIVGISNLLIQIRLHWDLTKDQADSSSSITNPIRFTSDVESSRCDAELEGNLKDQGILTTGH